MPSSFCLAPHAPERLRSCRAAADFGSGRSISLLLGGLRDLAQIRSFNFKNGSLGLAAPLRTRPWPTPLVERRPVSLGCLLATLSGNATVAAGNLAPRQAVYLRSARGGPPIHTDGLPAKLLPGTCNYTTRWRVNLQQPVFVEYYYPYQRLASFHLAGQKIIRFDPPPQFMSTTWKAGFTSSVCNTGIFNERPLILGQSNGVDRHVGCAHFGAGGVVAWIEERGTQIPAGICLLTWNPV